jgi:hypothetical protein
MFSNPRIWLLALIVVGQNIGQYGLAFFMPLIVKGLGVSTGMIGLVAALPYLFALVAMYSWGGTPISPANASGTWQPLSC